MLRVQGTFRVWPVTLRTLTRVQPLERILGNVFCLGLPIQERPSRMDVFSFGVGLPEEIKGRPQFSDFLLALREGLGSSQRFEKIWNLRPGWFTDAIVSYPQRWKEEDEKRLCRGIDCLARSFWLVFRCQATRSPGRKGRPPERVVYLLVIYERLPCSSFLQDPIKLYSPHRDFIERLLLLALRFLKDSSMGVATCRLRILPEEDLLVSEAYVVFSAVGQEGFLSFDRQSLKDFKAFWEHLRACGDVLCVARRDFDQETGEEK